MSISLSKITIRGFKSIEALEDFELRNLNILIGANGAGKSNFVEFFRMLRAMAEGRLDYYVTRSGGADVFFFMGPKYTTEMRVAAWFESNWHYSVMMTAGSGDAILLSNEQLDKDGIPVGLHRANNVRESLLRGLRGLKTYDEERTAELRPQLTSFHDYLKGVTSYHVGDSSMLSGMRRDQSVHDRHHLNQDGSNIASFLLAIRDGEPNTYLRIRNTIRHVAGFFDDFFLVPEKKGQEEKVRLEWKQNGSDYPFQPYQLSDGTIRFICLATALMQPNLPSLLIIDEPELGLHPQAIGILAELIESAATQTQVIVSTQSPQLLDHFACEDVIIVNREGDRSVFQRLDEKDYNVWLEKYSLGELWQMNVVEGGPR